MRNKEWETNRRVILMAASMHYALLANEIKQGLVAFVVLLGFPFYHGFRYLKTKAQSK